MINQLELRDVSISFGDHRAVKNVSLALQQGEIGCLLGPSGCGKTSLLRAIGGFENLAGGEIFLRDEVISRPGFTLVPEQRRVGMVFQDFALFPHLSVRKNISFGLSDLTRTQTEARVSELLKIVDLEAKADAFPHELSGGQQQRVALARALAPKPNILLLDEPFSSLDAELREQLALEVRELLKRDNITAILVTHDQHEAFAMADKITLLQAGSVAQMGSAYELYHRPASRFVAEFIGQGEIITVAVDADGNIEHGLGSLDKSQQNNTSEQTLRLLVRPDDISYNAASSIHLPIVQRTFRGAEYLYHLQLADGQVIPCLAPSHINIEEGANLPVSFDLQDVVVIEE